ncbi:MAG: hypothetical protein ACOCU4_04665 [Alkalispirochaeta sp.]|jgi:tetratricopeptide (TPR) repeat protein
MRYEEAVAALSTGAWLPAITALLGHLSHDPAHGKAWMYLGIAYSQVGFQEDSLRALYRADTLLEESAELCEAIGCTYSRMGQSELALADLNRAMSYPDCSASVYRNTAMLHLKGGHYLAALTAIETAMERDPDDVLTLLGKLFVLAGMQRVLDFDVREEMQVLADNLISRKGAPEHIRQTARQVLSEVS